MRGLGRAFTLRELARLLHEDDAAALTDPAERAAALTRGAAVRRGRSGRETWVDDLVDPYGASEAVRVTYRGRWDALSSGQKAVNRSHAKIRALVEQAVATLKDWRLLRKLWCSTTGSRTSSKPSAAFISPAQTEDGKAQ